MRVQLALGAAALAIAAAGAADAASVVEIKDAVARVTVIPENRRDVQVQMVTQNAALPFEMRQRGDRLIIDGNLRRRIRNCHGARWDLDFGNGRTSQGSAGMSVEVRGVGRVGWNAMPQIVIRTPLDVRVDAGGAVFGAIGRSNSVALDNAGCGDWTIANTRGMLDVDVAGSGDTRAGSAGSLNVSIAGSGDVTAATVAGPARIDIAGSGDVRMASINGRLDVNVAGSGDIKVPAGRAPAVDVDIAGSGDVDFGGTAQNLSVNVMGSGDVKVAQVTGQISRHIMGSGSVIVAGQEIKPRRHHDGDEDDQ
ncbi:MAG TPA: DUF2807 domain-containing protein [Caulobacteraceae bacterium]|jgi:hypothetical protein